MRSRLAQALVLLVLATFVAPLLAPAPAPAQSGPIKIGLLAPLTGPLYSRDYPPCRHCQ